MLEQDSREKLDTILFERYITDDKYIKNTQDIALKIKNKIRPERIAKVFNRQLDISVLQNYEVYYIAKALLEYPETGVEIIPKNFFTENEIDRFENIEDIDYAVKPISDIILHDVTEVLPNKMWACSYITAQEIANYMNSNLITYNPRTQRPSEKRVINGQVKERIKLNKKSVKEIRDLIVSDETDYPIATLTLNILSNGYEDFGYNKDTRTLRITINENNECDIIDGWHNLSSLLESLRIKPNLDQPYKIDIYKYTESEAKNFIHLRNKQNLFEEETESYYNTNNIYNILVNEINSEGSGADNFIKNKIGIDNLSVDLQDKYCTYDTLIKAIQDNFKLDKKDVRETRQVKKYLIGFFNELISIFKNDFENIKQSRSNNYITVNNMFYGYIALASQLYQQDKWQDKLDNVMSTINFKKTSSIWKGKGITSDKPTGKQIFALYGFFKNLVKEDDKEVAIDEK